MKLTKLANLITRSFNWLVLNDRLKNIELVILDVDGVLTDGGLWYGPSGELIKRFNVRDGLGIRLLQDSGIEVAFLSGGKGGATEIRANHLGIKHCLVNAKDKPAALEKLIEEISIKYDQILFIGDDLNDLSLKNKVGLLIATNDAHKSLLKKADGVLNTNGGNGAVREMAERLLISKGLWEQLNKHGWRDNNY